MYKSTISEKPAKSKGFRKYTGIEFKKIQYKEQKKVKKYRKLVQKYNLQRLIWSIQCEHVQN